MKKYFIIFYLIIAVCFYFNRRILDINTFLYKSYMSYSPLLSPGLMTESDKPDQSIQIRAEKFIERLGLAGKDYTLEYLSSRALIRLKDKLLDPRTSELMRVTAALVLGDWCSSEVVPWLMQAFIDSSELVRSQARLAVLSIGKEAIPYLIIGLTDDKSQPNSIYWEYSFTTASPIIKDRTIAQIRLQTAIVLGRISLNTLLEYLDHPCFEVKSAVISALGKLKYSHSSAYLIPLLNDNDARVRIKVISALSEIGGESARSALIAVVNDKSLEDSAMKVNALAGLESMDLPGLGHLLIESLNNTDSQLRLCAAASLGRIGNKEAVPSLIQALDDPCVNVRMSAVISLVQIGRPALGPLCVALKDFRENIRLGAVMVLARIKDTESVRVLIKSLKDTAVVVRQAAETALIQIASSPDTNRQIIKEPIAAAAANNTHNQKSPHAVITDILSQPPIFMDARQMYFTGELTPQAASITALLEQAIIAERNWTIRGRIQDVLHKINGYSKSVEKELQIQGKMQYSTIIPNLITGENIKS